MDKDKGSYAMMAMVAVVAIVAMVILVIMAGGGVKTTSTIAMKEGTESAGLAAKMMPTTGSSDLTTDELVLHDKVQAMFGTVGAAKVDAADLLAKKRKGKTFAALFREVKDLPADVLESRLAAMGFDKETEVPVMVDAFAIWRVTEEAGTVNQVGR